MKKWIMEKNPLKPSDFVCFQNHHWLIAHKPPGLPIQPDQSEVPDFLTALQAYTHHALHLLTRLDRPVSGLVLLIKSKTYFAYFQQLLSDYKVQKTYLALTGQRPQENEGEFIHWLETNSQKNISKVSTSPLPGYQKSHLQYQIIASSERYHLWKINLVTGRHHQIRAQLGYSGFPIQGDTKYGAPRANRSHFIHLHAAKIEFPHPVSNHQEIYKAAPSLDVGLWRLFQSEFTSLGL